MSKKTQPKTNPVHDFESEPIFTGNLLSETPEYFTFVTSEDVEVDVEKTPSLVTALRRKFNEVEIRKQDLPIIIEYLGEGAKGSKFSVSVDAPEE